MDEATQKVFKLKFIKLTLMLNLLLLLVALAIVAYFKAGPDLHLPVTGILALAAVLLGAWFWRSYTREKAWLDAQD